MAAFASTMLTLGGCASSDLAYDPAGAVDTGTYPNLNIAPQPAATQLAAAEKQQKNARLIAAQGSQQPPGSLPDPAAAARLQRLGQTHATDTLKAIEGS